MISSRRRLISNTSSTTIVEGMERLTFFDFLSAYRPVSVLVPDIPRLLRKDASDSSMLRIISLNPKESSATYTLMEISGKTRRFSAACVLDKCQLQHVLSNLHLASFQQARES